MAGSRPIAFNIATRVSPWASEAAMLSAIVALSGEMSTLPESGWTRRWSSSARPNPGFGLALLDHLLVQPDSGNVLISPLSATIALSMAASDAQGDTRVAMLKAMGLDPAINPSG